MTQDSERIRVGEEADGGESVELPVIDVLAGRGFITGKSGSGKSNTASVVAEQLLEAGYGLLIVDVDGEYYGLKEEYELLHAGADEECDIRVSPEHAGKLASLALEENVPIILDVSSYLDPADADEMLLAVARQLFAKAKKQKKPFLVLVEECHEYIPEGGGMTETGKMLIKIGKRGRKHGLGIVGMSQRPADVKKDFITQCDWMVWHRLTWDNDTRVVGRILGSEYADLVEELGDGEAFLDTDWTDDLRRVQFDRKRTFDAGATPGLEEFERPDLQSVSDDLVADLQQVSEERERQESAVASLEAELETKEQRIEELEAELAEARDMSEMADRFASALVDNADSPTGADPAASDVAQAEEFVADEQSDGDTGDDATAGDSGAELGSDEPADFADDEEELLPEEQRDLGAYAVSDGGERETEPDSEGDADSEPAEADADDSPAREESSGLKPVRTISSSTDSERPPADDDEEIASDDNGEAESDDAEETGSDDRDHETDDERDSDDEADTPDETESPNGSAEPPANTTDETGEEPEGETETDTDPTVERGNSAEESADAEAEKAATDTDSQDPAEAEDSQEDHSTQSDEETSGDASDTDESHTEEDDADATDPATVDLEDADEAEAPETELEAEPETWDQEPEPTAEQEPDPDDEPFEATGDWPTPDGQRTAHETEAGEPEPPTDPERTAALERQLAEEFGVTMESGSNLTGGSLGSSAPNTTKQSGAEDETDDTDEAVDDEPAETETTDDDSEPDSADTTADESRDQGNNGGSCVDPTADRGERLTELVEESELRNEEGVVQVFVHGIEALDEVTRGMLEHYRNAGEVTPVDAHVAAGGSGERQYAYARNRTLRTAGVVEHAGGGRYRYRLPDLVSEVFDGNVDEETLAETVSAIEEAAGLSE